MREICIFGVGDLPWLYQRPELFVNKFYADEHEPLAYDCMEELVYNRTVMQVHTNTLLATTTTTTTTTTTSYYYYYTHTHTHTPI